MLKPCIICNTLSCQIILDLTSENFDSSLLYKRILIACCNNCWHIFNLLSKEEEENLIKYYIEEYAPVNKNSINKQSDIPGSLNKNSMRRYDALHGLVQNHINKNTAILDIGCADGGFLKYLKQTGYKKLYGIDFTYDEEFKNKEIIIQKGFAENIPNFGESFDIIFADQVVEHLIDPNLIFEQVAKHIKPEGYFCISVPNAEKYNNNFFDFYWFLLREHVQHFDKAHLEMLANKHGFLLVDMQETEFNMTSKKNVLPNLTMLFRYCKETSWNYLAYSNLPSLMQTYIEESFNSLKKKQEILKLEKNIYVWGACRELLFLIRNIPLEDFIIIDDTPYKQKKMTFKGQKIYSSNILKNKDGTVVITAAAHTELIKEKLADLNFTGKIISL